jgi:hypothetical protein
LSAYPFVCLEAMLATELSLFWVLPTAWRSWNEVVPGNQLLNGVALLEVTAAMKLLERFEGEGSQGVNACVWSVTCCCAW